MDKIFFCFFLIIFTGCAKLAHLDELLTLKALSDDRDQQDLYVANRGKKFEKLVAALKDSSIGRFGYKKDFLKEFGEPILVQPIGHGSGNDVVVMKPGERWIYRYPVRPFGSPKVYLDFDRSGKLMSWQYISRDDNETVAVSQVETTGTLSKMERDQRTRSIHR